MGRMAIIPGTAGIIIPGAPKISMSDFDRRVAALPGLMHYVDPGTLHPSEGGRDRFSGARVTMRGTAPIANDPEFNNQPVMTLNGSNGPAILGTVVPDFTFIAAFRRQFVTANAQRLLSISRKSSDLRSFRYNIAGTTGFFVNISNPGTEPGPVASSENSPGNNEVFIAAISYNSEMKSAGISYTDSHFFDQNNNWGDAPSLDSEVQWSIGSIYAGGNGWQGKMGAAMIFDRALHLPTERPFMIEAIELLMSKYAIG